MFFWSLFSCIKCFDLVCLFEKEVTAQRLKVNFVEVAEFSFWKLFLSSSTFWFFVERDLKERTVIKFQRSVFVAQCCSLQRKNCLIFKVSNDKANVHVCNFLKESIIYNQQLKNI